MHRNLGQSSTGLGIAAFPESKLSSVEKEMLEHATPGTVCAAVKHIRKQRERAGSIGGTLISPLRQAAAQALQGTRSRGPADEDDSD